VEVGIFVLCLWKKNKYKKKKAYGKLVEFSIGGVDW